MNTSAVNFQRKSFFAKSQRIYLSVCVVCDLKLKMAQMQEKKIENFALVEIGSSIQCDMEMIFNAFNSYDINFFLYKKSDRLLFTLLEFALNLKNS